LRTFIPRERTGAVLMIDAKMDYKIELVARAFHEAEQDAVLWDTVPAVRKGQLREFARNAINLLNEDIGVLLLALEQSTADERVRGARLSA
jgi:hypothetical protein